MTASVPRTDELRLALVLNGGVSLAVWMGGVAFELNRLVRETHPVYRGLLELTGTAARIDVISGTSAGGINGAALALAQLHDRSLYSLRDVWLRTGGLDKLLHDPDDAELSSLLRGDEWFLPQIRAAFDGLAQGKCATPQRVPLSLSLTSTLLDGIAHKGLDDFGAEIEDTVHRALWEFPHLDADDDAFADSGIVDQLAFAARSTASFPVAFAPAHFKAQGDLFRGKSRLKALTSSRSDVVSDALLLDGGILDNQPFDAALKAISKLPAEGNTRRVLAYVVPDPAAAAERRDTQPDGTLERPTLAEAAWRSLVSIPASQSIAGHMADLREHNDATAARWRRIVGAVVHIRASGLLRSAALSLEGYRSRRVDGMIDYFLQQTERHLAALDGGGVATASTAAPGAAGRSAGRTRGMRRATKQWLASVWRLSARAAIEDRTRYWRIWQDALPHGMDPVTRVTYGWASRLPSHFEPAHPLLSQPWSWGLYALQFGAEFATEVLRRVQRLHALIPRWEQAERQVVDAPSSAWALGDGGEGIDDLALDFGRSAARAALSESGSRLDDPPLKAHWREAYALQAKVQDGRRMANREVGDVGGSGFMDFVSRWSSQGGEEPPKREALALLERLLPVSREFDVTYQAIAQSLFELLLSFKEPIERILAAHAQREGRSDVDEAVVELRELRRYLYEADPLEQEPGDGDARSPQEVLLDRIGWRVLALEVFEVTAGSRRQTPTAQAEIVQISARLRSAFGGSADPAEKLTGMQLAHFGAFYKRSWRANDWTFGCLDGIDRAVRIALNPDALQKRYGNRRVRPGGAGQVLDASQYVERYLYDLAVAGAAPAIRRYLDGLWAADLREIRDELAWLDLPATVPPPVLEHCARALTRRLQMETLRRELPEIATSLLIEQASGAPPSSAAGAPLLVRVAPQGKVEAPAPEAAAQLVRDNLLGSETIAMQVGTDHLTRTASRGLATAHGALSSKYGGLNSVNVLFKVTEWPLRVLYWLANRLLVDGRTAAIVESLAWGIGATIVIVAGMSEKTPAALPAFGWALLAGAAGAAALRSRIWGYALVVVLAVALMMLKQVSLVGALLLIAAFALLQTSAGALFAMLAVIGLAAWWSAGGSGEAATLLWHKYRPLADAAAPAPAPSASAAEQLQRLEGVLWPALFIGVLLVLIAGLRAAAGHRLPRDSDELSELERRGAPPSGGKCFAALLSRIRSFHRGR
jgi:patatin-related protein